jgi:hypothetical protein
MLWTRQTGRCLALIGRTRGQTLLQGAALAGKAELGTALLRQGDLMFSNMGPPYLLRVLGSAISRDAVASIAGQSGQNSR